MLVCGQNDSGGKWVAFGELFYKGKTFIDSETALPLHGVTHWAPIEFPADE